MANRTKAVRLDRTSLAAIMKIVKAEDLTVSQVLRRAVREFLVRRKKGKTHGK